MLKSLDDDAAAVEFVAHDPGTVGYIDKHLPTRASKYLMSTDGLGALSDGSDGRSPRAGGVVRALVTCAP
jgi:hypothetical protein